MSEHERITPELKAFEAMLAGLEPAAPALDRDRLMYEAGRASMDAGGRRAWPVATLCVGLIAMMVGRWTAWTAPNSEPKTGDRPLTIAVAEPRTTPTIDEASWVRLRQSLGGDDLAAHRPTVEQRPMPHAPSAPTWLEERRRLLEHLN
jgi:hypothetical protein